MHRESATRHPARISLAALAIVMTTLALPACESTSNWLKGRRTAEATDTVELGTQDADLYLTELRQLATGDPATQAEIFADAESAAMLTPSTSTHLRYALVLALPGHPGSDASQAQGMLHELLAQPELMTAAENSLAAIFLKNTESQMVSDAESRRLRSETSRAATTEEAAVAQRMARIETENRQLRQALSDAEAKLEAITTIERSIREQSAEDEPR